MKLAERVRIEKVKSLADDWAILKKTTLSFQRADGSWQTLTRETYDRGNGSPLLLINRERRTVLLIRQFRYSAFVNGATDLLIEACAGLLHARDPETAIKDEVEEELGVRVSAVSKVFESYMSRARSPRSCTSSSRTTPRTTGSRRAAASRARARTSRSSSCRSTTRWR